MHATFFSYFRLFLRYMQNDEPVWHGYLYAFGLALCNFVQMILFCSYIYGLRQIGLNTRSVLMAVIFRKVSLRAEYEKWRSHSDASNLVSKFSIQLRYI